MIRALAILGGVAAVAGVLAVNAYESPAPHAYTGTTPAMFTAAANSPAGSPSAPSLSPLATASTAPTVPPTVSTPPSPSAAAASPAPVTVPMSSSAPPSPTAAPVEAGPGGYQVPWSADDCGWAQSTLAWDASLDAQEAAAIEDGQDTRYPGQAPLYTTFSGRWTMIATWYAAACQGTRMAYPEWYDSMIWMNAAITGHVSDEQANPQAALWDSTWIGNYQRLESMLGEISGQWPTS